MIVIANTQISNSGPITWLISHFIWWLRKWLRSWTDHTSQDGYCIWVQISNGIQNPYHLGPDLLSAIQNLETSGLQIPHCNLLPQNTFYQNLVGRVQALHCLWADAEFPLSELKHTSSEFQCFHFGLMPLRRLTARQIPPCRNSRLTGSPRPTKYIRGIQSMLCSFLSRSSLRLSSQISRLRQVTRQM